ncbi:anti-sigma factor [Nocardia farcinica]|uniref:anti-sigma factor n=1 Tax=Nocardia farcinica TaxID=37329 RepID=UPI001894FA74|nr:anti-sigma factor [Nocardia farcinica]MBF6411492.1 anti-sigma factor [Nocardia farcinica]
MTGISSKPPVHVHTLTGAYVLNALSETDRGHFEHHLGACQACADEVLELREALGRLGAAVAEGPPAHLKERVLATASSTRQLPPEVDNREVATTPLSAPDKLGSRAARWSRRAAVPVAAAAVIAAIVLGYQRSVTTSELRQQITALQQVSGDQATLIELLTSSDARLVQQPAADDGTLTVVFAPSHDAAAVLSAHMPSAPDQHTYQVWILHGSETRSVGTMAGGPQSGMVLARGVGGEAVLALTVEPDGGSLQPTRPPMITIPLA